MKISKLAFSLAEVMLCLGIIAVLTAIVAPAVMSKRPNKNMVMFKKSYNQIERSVYELINDEHLYPEVALQSYGFAFYNTNSSDVDHIANSADMTVTSFCNNIASKLNISSEISCVDNSNTTTGRPSFTTNDGVDWYFFPKATRFCDPEQETCENSLENCSKSVVAHTPMEYACIVLDVNGSDAPNSFNDLRNQDRFQVQVRYDGHIEVTDIGNTNSLLKTSSLK